VRGWLVALVWVAFLADLLVGAGLLTSARPALRGVGLAMLVGAAVVLAGLTLWFYLQNRRSAGPKAP